MKDSSSTMLQGLFDDAVEPLSSVVGTCAFSSAWVGYMYLFFHTTVVALDSLWHTS